MSMPAQLAKDNKKFQYKLIRKEIPVCFISDDFFKKEL